MPAAKKSARKRAAKKSTTRKNAATKPARKSTAKSAKKAAKKPARKSARKSAQKSTKSLAKGDHVTWTTSQGETHGVVERKLTSPMHIKEHKVSASPDNPEYLVRSDKSGDIAAHKPGSLHKTSGAKTGAAKRTKVVKKARKAPKR